MPKTKLIPLAAFLCLTGCGAGEQPDVRPRNIIFFISDGCGPASFTLARQFERWRTGAEELALDPILVGSVRTHSASHPITDSAAAGTAFACGVRTYNGAIAVDTAGRPVATILEAAETLGMATGLVATSTITHATPATFSAHVLNRADQNSIAAQQLTQGIDVLLGGGADYFLPVEEKGARVDGRNLIDEAAAAGYSIARSRDDLLAIDDAPVLGLFAGGHMAYEIDRDPRIEPSLAEMTRYSIELLARNADGFFLMVEGSRIDHAAHANDAPAHLHDILAFDKAVSAALEFARADGETLVISTSDHETGGLSVGARLNGSSAYTWHPERLAAARRSLEFGEDSLVGTDNWHRIPELVGIEDPSEDELHLAQDGHWPRQSLADAVSGRARVGWTTGGHTAVDVNMYAYGPGSSSFAGHLDITDVGLRLAELMRVDLEGLSAELRSRGAVTSTAPAGP